MIVDDSFSRLTTRMAGFRSAVFSKNRRARLKWPLQVSREAQLQLQKFVFTFKMIIMTKKILRTKITERRNLRKKTQELEEAAKKEAYH